MAHDCHIPQYSLDAPASPNWMVFRRRARASFTEATPHFAQCDGAAATGYDALVAEGVPVGITIFARMTIGHSGAGEDEPRRRADGVGLEYLGAGSTLTDEMVATWIEGADAYAC